MCECVRGCVRAYVNVVREQEQCVCMCAGCVGVSGCVNVCAYVEVCVYV